MVVEETKQYNAAVIVTSDSCSKELTKDESGTYVKTRLQQTGLFSSVHRLIIGDDKDKITGLVEEVLANQDPALIITVGGTGLCPRDVTPEATSVLYERHCNGIVAAITQASLRYTPFAALNRLTAGITGGTLIINFAGKPEACQQSMATILPILEHALHSIRYDYVEYSAAHRRQQRQKPQADLEPLPEASRSSASLASQKVVSKSNGIEHNDKATSKSGSITPTDSRSSSVSQTSKLNKFTIESILESRSEMSIIEQGQSNVSRASSCSRPASIASSKKFSRFKKQQVARAVSAAQHAKALPLPKPKLVSNIQPKTPQAISQPQLDGNLPSVKILQNQSQFAQIPYSESLRILAEMSSAMYSEPEVVNITTFSKAFNCLGCTLAEDLKSKRIVPPYAVSTVDGYALHVPAAMSKLIASGQLKTASQVPIVDGLGEFERLQKDGANKDRWFCYQVNTGGRLPKYDFAVVPTESATRLDGGSAISIKEMKQHRFVRRAGSDLSHDDVIKMGTSINSAELSSIIAMGHKTFKILPKPRLGILSTGDELEDFFDNEFISQDAVVDTNGPMLRSMFRLQNFFVAATGLVRDEPNELLLKMSDTLKKCDVLVVTGGASMGTRDHVKDVILHMGGEIHFGRVDLKPGKPAAFASIRANDKRKFIFSLPGNPVSAFVTTLVLVNPFLKHAPESRLKLPKRINDHLGESILVEIGDLEASKEGYRFDGRLEFIRAKILTKKKALIDNSLQAFYSVQVSVKQQSSRLLSLIDCDCLIMIDPDRRGESLTTGVIYPAIKLVRKY